MMPVSAEAMKALDAMAARNGIPVSILMENAGRAVAEKAARLLKNKAGKNIAVFCGKGNNGGDGMAAARKLKERGYKVTVFLVSGKDEVKNEAAANMRAFTGTGGKLEELTSAGGLAGAGKRLGCDLLIDALLGTGLSGPVSDLYKKAIETMNAAGVPILSVDIPSGLNATTGEANPVAVKADWTISFALPKKGFFVNNGPDCAKSIDVVNIGFPEELLKQAIEYEKSKCEK